MCQAFAVHCEGEEGDGAEAECDFEVSFGTVDEQFSVFWSCLDFDEICGVLLEEVISVATWPLVG